MDTRAEHQCKKTKWYAGAAASEQMLKEKDHE